MISQGMALSKVDKVTIKRFPSPQK